ncbi:MAG: hypothetical protein Q9171_004454 [Xanthocarpia ochracea]
MSTIITTSSSSASPPATPPSRTWIPTSTPISLLPTPTARLYHHIHPILILSLFYLSFPSLVANPVSTLSKLLFPVAGSQMLYCVLSLPIAKAGVLPKIIPGTRKTKPKQGGKKMKSEMGVVREKVVVRIPQFKPLLISIPVDCQWLIQRKRTYAALNPRYTPNATPRNPARHNNDHPLRRAAHNAFRA